MKKLYLIGTAHTLQKGMKNAPPDCYEEFKKLLYSTNEKYMIKIIAEEMSEEVLGSTLISLCKDVATKLGISHVFCDPNREERKALPTSMTEFDARELEWLNRLNQYEFPVLFVCGAKHVCSFTKKCSDSGISVKILEKDWKPTKNIPLEYRLI
jgi:hypothetical protein